MNSTPKPRGTRLVGVVFLTSALVVGATTTFTYLTGQVALESNRRVDHQRAVITQLGQFVSTMKDAEASQRGYLLVLQDQYLPGYTRAVEEVRKELKSLERLGQQGDLEPADVQSLRTSVDQKVAEMEKTVSLARDGRLPEAVEMVRSDAGQKLMTTLRNKVGEMEERELAEFKEANARSEHATYQRTATFVGVAILDLLFLWWAYQVLLRETHRRERVEEELRQHRADLELRVQARTAELAAANRDLEAFGYSVSHDLRAPLRHVNSYIRLLEKDLGARLDSKSRHYLQVITAAAERMGRLIDDLLMLSRIGRARMVESKVSLAQLVEEARVELAPVSAGRQIEWKIAPLPAVRGDPALLRSAMVNLLSNAIKYTRGRDPATIEIECGDRNGELVCSVRDNGAGFDMKYAEKLFGVFQRLHPAEEFEGTGIGLASVRRVIQRHGGHTWAESEPDHGAAFYFSLPKERVMT